MTIKPFTAEELDLPDEELGIRLLACWIGFQAERNGFPPDTVPPEIADKIVTATLGVDSLNIKNIALEKCFRLAASGDLTSAGNLLRQYMLASADNINKTKLAERGKKFKTKRAKGSMSTRNKYIHALANQYPEKTPLELFRFSDGTLIPREGYKYSTFEKEVSKARNPKK